MNHQIVMLRFFAGLTTAQIADALGVTERTVERRWRYVRARLHKELGGRIIEEEGLAQ